MAINIRELFDIDSENVRLEKINYNFDQIVANGGGPIGLQGAKGDVGPDGAKGQKGEVGAQGPQGPAGTATDYFYVKEHSASFNNNILVPLSDSDHSRPSVMLFGVWTDGIDTSQVMDYDSSPILVKFDKAANASAIRIVEDDFDSGMNIKWENAGATSDMTFNVSGLAGIANYIFKGNSLKVNVAGVDKVDLGSTSTFNSPVVFNSSLKLNAITNDGYYLRSDASGNASWSSLPTSLVPVGTIVLVGTYVLSNFVNWNGVFPTPVTGNYIGRGTGPWAGWYFCWGQSWGVDGAQTYPTPDLRERYPMGFAGTSGSFGPSSLLSGSSEEAKYAAAGFAAHSTSGTNGYYGTNDIDQLQAKSTLNAHKHSITHTNYQVNVATSGTTVWVPGFGSQYAQMQTNDPITTPTTDVTPRSAVVGYMIYLGNASLRYGGII